LSACKFFASHAYAFSGSCATYTTRCKVACHPPPVSIALLLVAEHGLVGITESEVQGLGREVSDDVGSVATPQRSDTLIGAGTAEALHDTVVLAVKTALLQHLVLNIAHISALVVSPLPKTTNLGSPLHALGSMCMRSHWVMTYLVLNEELDTLNGCGSGLRDGGGDTTHCGPLSALACFYAKFSSSYRGIAELQCHP